MATDFPTSIQSLTATRGTSGQPLSAPNHVTHHTTEDDTIVALQTKVGVDGSAVTTTHDYKLGEVTGADKAVGKTAAQTLTNKTLTSPKITAGAMSKGDMLQLSASDGTLTPLRATANANIPSWNSTTEQWEAIANPAASDASLTVKGVVEIATTAEITAGTSLGATGAKLVVPADAVGSPGASKIVQYTAAGKYPAADGSLITNLATNKVYATTTPVSIDNTEKTLMTTTVTGGTLSTNNTVRGMAYLSSIAPETGSTRTYIFRFKYGATTVVTSTLTTDNSGTALSGWYEFVLYGDGATNAQKMTVRALFSSGAFTVNTSYQTAVTTTTGTSAEDSTADKTLAVTVQSSTSGSVGTFDTGFIEKIF